jgi:hypothetical protein
MIDGMLLDDIPGLGVWRPAVRGGLLCGQYWWMIGFRRSARIALTEAHSLSG